MISHGKLNLEEYKSSLTLLIILLPFYYAGILIISHYFIVDIFAGFYSDEGHFYETVTLFFSKGINHQTLAHYEDMSGPLPFLYYVLWAKVFGLSIFSLRISSIFISIITIILAHRIFYDFLKNGLYAFVATVFFMVNPYIGSTSVLIYTDMLPLLFMLVGIMAVYRNNPVLLILSVLGTMLSRQYYAFFVIALGLYFLLQYLKQKDFSYVKMLSAVIIACLPFIYLVYLWKGLSPDNKMKSVYQQQSMTYHISYLFSYMIFFFVYLSPFILIFWKKFYYSRKLLIYSFILSLIYFLFPVSIPDFALKGNFYTVGIFHQIFRLSFNSPTLEQIFFFLCFFASIPVFFYIAKHFIINIKGKIGLSSFLDTAMISFLVVMPLSYLFWEKYLVPILILALFRGIEFVGQKNRKFVL